ncbi:sensor histidine kinase [Roseospirillum parvum]|uniref:histidine kinase n=1 Tax=Roseospirillum parvum TaxID=83401 RepID=A0A1G8BK45_9PROT|nr:HAMP domain-containing sensor histidine kinase [Roseospirillum parvum]SDH33607.1 Signal transduction histidine kinase [Roseospirillum parvum]
MQHHPPGPPHDPSRDPLIEPLAQLVHQAPIGLAEIAEDGTVLLINPTAAQVLMPFVVDRRLDNLFVALGPAGEALKSLCQASGRRAGRLLHGYRINRPGGGPTTEGPTTGGPTTLGVNVTRAEVDRLIVVLEDLSELIAAERAARQAQAQADAANMAKSSFLAGTSHELRQPLNAILGFAEVMREEVFGPLPERYRGYLGDIHSAGGHLLALINDLLDLSKVEAGEMHLARDPVDLDAVFADCRRLFAARAEAKNLDLQAEAGGLVVLADRRRLDQVLINLVSNALKFTPAGGTVRLAADPEPPDRVRLTVTDSGVGIAPEDLNRVMQPFGQTAEGRRQDDGTGLGLSLARALAEAMGGGLELASQPGVGTTATVLLPAPPAD